MYYYKMETIKKMKRKSHAAMTLAEVLITMGIIVTVVAMTISTIMSNIQNFQLKTTFKKAYSVASQAWSDAVADNPNTFTAKGGWATCHFLDGTTGDVNANDGRTDAFKSKMKVVKYCVNKTGCWSENYEFDSMLGTYATGAYSPYYYGWITTDGMCWSAPWKGWDEATILVDTNCNNPPNKIGQDIFPLLLGADGVVYFAIDDTTNTGKPMSSGLVCPKYTSPATINGRSVDFKSLQYS